MRIVIETQKPLNTPVLSAFFVYLASRNLQTLRNFGPVLGIHLQLALFIIAALMAAHVMDRRASPRVDMVPGE